MIEVDTKQFPKILKLLFLYYCYIIKGNSSIILREEDYIYRFDYTESTSIYSFYHLIEKEYPQYLTIDWLFNYLNFQFTKWVFVKQNKEIQIKAHWLFGKKGLGAYLNRTKQQEYWYHSSFFPTYQIKKEDIINLLLKKGLIKETEEVVIEEEEIITFNPLNEQEENFKKKKYNTIEGFYICSEYTTLFKYSSNYCKNCNYKQNCKKLLKKSYPKLYQKRFAKQLIKKRLELEKNDAETTN